MNDRVVVFLNDEGGVAVFYPAAGVDPAVIGPRVVPAGRHFAVVPVSDIPSDRSERERWTIDPAILIDGVGEPGL